MSEIRRLPSPLTKRIQRSRSESDSEEAERGRDISVCTVQVEDELEENSPRSSDAGCRERS